MENANAVGSRIQTRLFACPLIPIKCRKEEFLTREISDEAIQIAAYWEAKGI